jgi:hypothetical protein
MVQNRKLVGWTIGVLVDVENGGGGLGKTRLASFRLLN